MKRQITVKVDPDVEDAVDHVAAKYGLSLTEFVRHLIGESLVADKEERPLFTPSQKPSLPGNLDELVPRLHECIVELDRSQRENQKHVKRFLDSFIGSEAAVNDAQRILTQRLVETRKAANEPFLVEVSQLRADFAALPQQQAAVIGDCMSQLATALSEIKKLAASPRTENLLILARDRRISFGILGTFVGIMLFAGIAATLAVVASLQTPLGSAAMPVIAEPATVCRIIDTSFAVKNCKVPESVRLQAIDKIEKERRPRCPWAAWAGAVMLPAITQRTITTRLRRLPTKAIGQVKRLKRLA